jgi:hypothetical protein
VSPPSDYAAALAFCVLNWGMTFDEAADLTMPQYKLLMERAEEWQAKK